MNVYVVSFLSLLLIGQSISAQSVIKLRMGIGYYISFGANPQDTFEPWDEIDNNGIIEFHSRKTFALYDNVEYPFYLEYEHNQNWGFSTGVILNSFAPVNMYFYLPSASSTINPETGTYYAGSNGGGIVSGVGLTKIPFLFSVRMFRFGSLKEKIEINEKAFFVQTNLTIGGGLWFRRGPNNQIFQSEELASWETEDINGGSYKIKTLEYFPNKYSGCLSFGIDFSLRTRKHEYAKLHIAYEQGLTNVTSIRSPYYYSSNGKTYEFNGPYSFTRGSNISFRLSFPVFTYNFSKKKFYRD